MTYPRDSAGIDWREHYTMADQVYAAFMSDTTPMHRVVYSPTSAEGRAQQERLRRKAGAKKRQYLSKYVGVTWHRYGWLSQWGASRTDIKRSAVYPPTDDGQEQAAWARARALGRDWLEMRPADQVKPTTPPVASGEARGKGRRKVGGKRIG